MNKLDSQMTKAFKTYLETGYKAVSGIADIDVDFTTFEGGFAGQNFQTVQLARDNTESVTISVYELAGSPIREYLDTWVTGVRDPVLVSLTIMASSRSTSMAIPPTVFPMVRSTILPNSSIRPMIPLVWLLSTRACLHTASPDGFPRII